MLLATASDRQSPVDLGLKFMIFWHQVPNPFQHDRLNCITATQETHFAIARVVAILLLVVTSTGWL